MMMYDVIITPTSYGYTIQSQGLQPTCPKPKNRANSLAKWKWALIGSACISLVGIVIGVSVVFGRLREDPPPAIAFQIPGFFPYIHGTIGNSKTDVRQAITFPSTVKWRLLGGDEMLELNGYVYARNGYITLTGGTYQSARIGVSMSKELYDKPETTKDQYFVIGKTISRDDKSLLACLIPGFEAEMAFVYTWINFTLKEQSVGSFQIILALAADSTMYVIRTYYNDVIDVGKDQFTIYCEEKPYEDNLTATNVRGSHQVYAMSELPVNDQLVQLEIINTCGM